MDHVKIFNYGDKPVQKTFYKYIVKWFVIVMFVGDYIFTNNVNCFYFIFEPYLVP